MTGFIIFAIVLTLAYVLYFAAMITTDLAAMKKAAETEEENIDIGTGSEEVDEFATQNVVEDPSTGGFNFVTPQQKEAEASEEIVEAEEDENDDDPSASLRNQDEDENVGARMPLTSKTQRQSLPMKTLAFLRFMISLNQKKSQSKRHSRKTMPSTQV